MSLYFNTFIIINTRLASYYHDCFKLFLTINKIRVPTNEKTTLAKNGGMHCMCIFITNCLY